jgi:hypothetical protein
MSILRLIVVNIIVVIGRGKHTHTPSNANDNRWLLHFFLSSIVNIIACLSSTSIIDSEIGNRHLLLVCPIDRTEWTPPSILQWYRSTNNYSIPIASQFDDYPVHIDETYRQRYSLLSNGSLQIENVQLSDNDTFECRLILIDRGLLDVKRRHLIQLRVDGKRIFKKRLHSENLGLFSRMAPFYPSIRIAASGCALFDCGSCVSHLRCSHSHRDLVQGRSRRRETKRQWWRRFTITLGQ